MSRDPLKIASRMSHIEASGIRKFFDLAQSMKDPIDLSIGQPHFDPPESVKQAAIEAIKGGRNRYTVTQGIEPLRERIRERLTREHGLSRTDDVLVTSGVGGGLTLALLCVLDIGDELMIPDPYFVMYKHLARVAGATPVAFNTYPNFEITRAALDAAYSPKSRAIIVNSPSNPTGYMMSEAETKLVADFAREKGLLVISDEIYEFFQYGRRHISPRRFYEHTLILGGYSKNLGIPGWRMGYAAGPAPILSQMRTLQQFTFVCAPSPAQFGVLAGLDGDYEERRAEYQRKRDLFYNGIKDSLEVVKPEGAFYIFPKVPEGTTGGEFVKRCIEKSLLVVPGSACSSRDTHIRISYAASDELLKRGIDVLNAVAKSFR